VTTVAQVRALVRKLRRGNRHGEGPGPIIAAARVRGEWVGPATVAVDGEDIDVVVAISELALREALVEHEESERSLVVLTRLEEGELGTDVLARVARRRVHRLDPWETVAELFGAREIDPRLRREPTLAEALVEAAPPDGYPPVPTGLLDRDTAWRELLRAGFGLEASDLRDLLLWTRDPTGHSRFLTASPQIREEAAVWLTAHLGPAAAAVIACVEAGHADDAVAIGLACQVVFGDTDEGIAERAQARVRLEPLLGGRALDERAAAAWADAAEAIVRGAGLPEGAAGLLADLRVEAYAFRSDILPTGFEQRLVRFAERLAMDDLDGAARAAHEVLAHELAQRQPARAQAVEMALRLARWVHEPPAEVSSLVEAAERYAREGGLIDRARAALWEGDPIEPVAANYRRIGDEVAAAREDENQAFGWFLAEWLETGSSDPRMVPVERVLDVVVAPVAAAAPMLLIILDALSFATWEELREDLAALGWIELDAPPMAIAALPSITTVSRSSLLAGRLTSDPEKASFASNPRLIAASRASKPPLLFQKGDLVLTGGTNLPQPVAAAIADGTRRVVGAVVNAIDDLLAKGEQVRTAWTVASIRPLDALLDAARAAGRAVVVASDHGHIAERDLTYRRTQGWSERWREDDGKPEADEVVLAGPRVLRGNGRIIAPWSEGVRYAPRKHGYHGGASPQEVVTPLGVLSIRGAVPAGMKERDRTVPAWWQIPRDETRLSRQHAR
jgi:hypothetical protein